MSQIVKFKIKASEVKRMSQMLTDINGRNLESIDFLDDNNEIIPKPQFLIEEFLETGLNNVDFILTNFYLRDILTVEEKFKKLLEIAVKYGYTGAYWSNCVLTKNNTTDKGVLDWKNFERIELDRAIIHYKGGMIDSINDLVTNYGKNELCFIDALIRAYIECYEKKPKRFEKIHLISSNINLWITEPSKLTRDIIIEFWGNLETERRLIWLFELFDCLLCKNTKQ